MAETPKISDAEWEVMKTIGTIPWLVRLSASGQRPNLLSAGFWAGHLNRC